MTWQWAAVIIFGLPCLLLGWGMFWGAYRERTDQIFVAELAEKQPLHKIKPKPVTVMDDTVQLSWDEMNNDDRTDFQKLEDRVAALERKLDDRNTGMDPRS